MPSGFPLLNTSLFSLVPVLDARVNCFSQLIPRHSLSVTWWGNADWLWKSCCGGNSSGSEELIMRDNQLFIHDWIFLILRKIPGESKKGRIAEGQHNLKIILTRLVTVNVLNNSGGSVSIFLSAFLEYSLIFP